MILQFSKARHKLNSLLLTLKNGRVGKEIKLVATLYTPGMDKVIFLDVTECMNHDSGRTGVVVGKFSLIYIFMNVKIQLFLVWEAGEGGSYITFDE